MRLEGSRVHSWEQVASELRSVDRQIVTFGGFGELGYEDEEEMLRLCAAELAWLNPRTTVINTGTLITEGFQVGIAAVYQLAKSLGFTTVGVHPSIALCHSKAHSLAPGVDHAFFVSDTTWGGLRNDGHASNTLKVLLEVTDRFIAVGGGLHTAQELRTFLTTDKAVHFYPAQMHRQTAVDWITRVGATLDGFDGSAQDLWNAGRLHA